MVNHADDMDMPTGEKLPENPVDPGADREVKAALDSISLQYSEDIKSAAGEHATEGPSSAEAADALREPLKQGDSESGEAMAPEVDQAPTAAPVALQMTSTADATGLESHVYGDLDTDIRRAAKTGAAGAATGAALFGGAAAIQALPAGSGAAAVMGGAAALSGAFNFGLAALGAYTGGMLHKLVWKTPPEKSGFWRTIGRGFVAPASVPIGVVYRLFGGGKKPVVAPAVA